MDIPWQRWFVGVITLALPFLIIIGLSEILLAVYPYSWVPRVLILCPTGLCLGLAAHALAMKVINGGI